MKIHDESVRHMATARERSIPEVDDPNSMVQLGEWAGAKGHKGQSDRTLRRAAARARTRNKEKVCEQCGVEMLTAYKTTRYCSNGCRKNAYNDKIRATVPPTDVIICLHCGVKTPWWKQINSKRKKYCSQDCASRGTAGKSGGKGKNLRSLLKMKTSSIDRTEQCHRKLGPFEIARCKHYHNWLTETTQFNCECGGFEL